MATGALNVADALDAALGEGSSTATQESTETAAAKAPTGTETQVDTSKGATGKDKTPQTVPYSRLAEVVLEKNTASEQAKEFKKLYEESLTKQGEITSKLESMQKEVDVLERVRSLATDDRYKDHVMAIDKALRGIEDQIDAGEVTSEEGAEQALKVISKHKEHIEQVEEKLAEERASRLFNEASNYFDQLVATLEGYGDEDKKAIAKDCAEKVDWSSIEADEAQLRPLVRTALKSSLEEYGEPRAALKARIAELESQKTAQVTNPVETPEKAIDGLLSKDYSQLDEKGKPLVSDVDFAKDLAKMMKLNRAEI
jgi:hypothetical protein